MLANYKSQKQLTDYREKLHEVLDRAWLVFRPNNLPQLLKPIRVKAETVCVITGKKIFAGDFAYPCYSNPVRLSPTGPNKCLIEEAEKLGNKILPEGYYVHRIPTMEELMESSAVKKHEAARNLALGKETIKLLR